MEMMNQTGNCYIFGAGDFDGLLAAPAPGDLILAADGGFRTLTALGIDPDLVLGDFDSLGAPPDHPRVLRVPSEKDDTDMMLAVKTALEQGCHTLYLYGGLGGSRIDHTLANIQTLLYAARRGARAYLIGCGAVLTVIQNGKLTFPAGFRGFLSVFCAGESARGVTLRGLKYPLRDAVLTCDVPLGVSNEFCGEPACVEVADGSLLVTWQAENPVLP